MFMDDLISKQKWCFAMILVLVIIETDGKKTCLNEWFPLWDVYDNLVQNNELNEI